MRTHGTHRSGLRTRAVVVIAVAALSVVLAVGAAVGAVTQSGPFAGTHEVGQTVHGGTLLPSNQWDVAALGWNEFQGYLTIINVKTHKILQQTALASPTAKAPTDESVGPDGPLYSSDGTTLWVPQSTYLDRFAINPTTGTATETASIALCGDGDPTSIVCDADDEGGAADGSELPAGMTLSRDGATLYVALNGANELAEIDTATNTVEKTIRVGNAPRQVVLADGGTVAYVSNEGGYPAKPGEFTNLSDGTPMVANKVTGAASTGTVSVVNLTTGVEEKEIRVGLQPTAMHMDGDALMVANSNDDSLSVIDTRTNTVSQTVNTNPVPGATVGSYANAISMPTASKVLVSIGRDNAIAEYTWHGLAHTMSYDGLIPTDWYPVQVQPDPALGRNMVVVTNDKGIGARGPESTLSHGPFTTNKKVTGHNSYDDTGSVTVFKLPTAYQLKGDTRRVFTDNAWDQIKPINQGKYDTVPSVIPRTIGEPSPIKHVVVIVKENRTYDQVLGDLGEGNGDPADAEFGKHITPNLHALASRFGDFDNFYDEGTLSADGHNWIVQAGGGSA
jgi:YVTN family beta-propeller protein